MENTNLGAPKFQMGTHANQKPQTMIPTPLAFMFSIQVLKASEIKAKLFTLILRIQIKTYEKQDDIKISEPLPKNQDPWSLFLVLPLTHLILGKFSSPFSHKPCEMRDF